MIKKLNGWEKVNDCEHLLSFLADGGRHEFCILLIGGLISCKGIALYGENKFDIWNSIDDTWQTLTKKGLYSKSNIGKAIDDGNFFHQVDCHISIASQVSRG